MPLPVHPSTRSTNPLATHRAYPQSPPTLAGEPPPDKGTEILDAIERMGALARRQVTETKAAFRTRNVALVGDLVGQGAGIGPINREIFNRAAEIGDHVDAREWAMFMILVARAVERIADNAVEIAEQTAFVVTGLFREFTYASSPPARSDHTDSSRLGVFGSPQGPADPPPAGLDTRSRRRAGRRQAPGQVPQQRAEPPSTPGGLADHPEC